MSFRPFQFQSTNQPTNQPTSDELSYPLHVVLRVEIEAALLRGEIDVSDVPRIWNEKMENSLGCVPPADDGRVNCLQDMCVFLFVFFVF